MDHQDWPGWPDDAHADHTDPHHEPADHVEHVEHAPPFDHDPFADPWQHDTADPAAGGHDLGYDPGTHDAGDAGGHVSADEITHDLGYADDSGYGHDGGWHEPGWQEVDPHRPDVLDALPDHDPATVDHPVGADPDADPRLDADWPGPAFPPHLDLPVAPEPVDGYPWSDPALLGDATADPTAYAAADVPTGHPAGFPVQPPHADEVAGYAGAEPGTGWRALLDSDDPATSALARWWAPDESPAGDVS